MGHWEVLEYIGELLVLLGVAGEVFSDWREGNRLAKASSLVLIIGLALSLAALKRTNEYFNGTIAGLNLKASQANERAHEDEAAEAVTNAGAVKLGIELENAKAGTERLARSTAEADRAADRERIERLKLEREIVPRRVNKKQWQALRLTCLMSLPYRQVKVDSYVSEPEAAILALQIAQSLNCGRKDFVIDQRGIGSIAAGGIHIGIEVFGTDNDLVESIRNDLAPLAVIPEDNTPAAADDDPPATIRVGSKPYVLLK